MQLNPGDRGLFHLNIAGPCAPSGSPPTLKLRRAGLKGEPRALTPTIKILQNFLEPLLTLASLCLKERPCALAPFRGRGAGRRKPNHWSSCTLWLFCQVFHATSITKNKDDSVVSTPGFGFEIQQTNGRPFHVLWRIT